MALNSKAMRSGMDEQNDASQRTIAASDPVMERQSNYPDPLNDNSPEMKRLREQMREAEKYLTD